VPICVAALPSTSGAVTLSGTIVYTGTHGPVSSTRRILVFLMDTSSLSSETTVFPKAKVTTNPGTFSFDVPAPGNYYLFYSLDEHDDGDLNVGTPFSVYNGRCTFPADPIAAPQSNVQLELGDTCFAPGIAGKMTYTGNLGPVSPGHRLCLQAFTDPDLLTSATGGIWGLPCGTNQEDDEGYDAPTFDTRTYYLRAFLDVNGNSAFDPGEPFQIYNNKGVPPGDPVVASTTQTNINFTFGDENVMPSTCVGDCDGNGSVTVDEILTMVNIALGNAPCSDCVAARCPVTIDQILTAVNNALNACPVPVATPTPTPTVTSPFVGEFTGTLAVTAGTDQGLTGKLTIVIGANGVAGAAAQISNGFGGDCFSGVANLVTGAVTLTQLSEQLSGDITASVQLKASGSSVTGGGTFTVSEHGGTKNSSGTVTITAGASIASNYVGVYLGTINITAGPDGTNNWPIQLFVLNDGTAAGDTFDPAGDGFQFQGTVDFDSGAFTLAVNGGSEGLTGITGHLTGLTLANGTFDLSNGDMGTVSFLKVAP
jgi:hypothetical protein